MKNMLLVAIATFVAIAAVGTVIALSSPTQVQTQNETTSATQDEGSILVQTPEPFNVTTTQADSSATILVTLNLAQENTTTVIPENGTVIQVPGNVTIIDNDTVIIAPENETITEIDGNITVISPVPLPEPEPCGCPPVSNETAGAGNETTDTGIPDVIITPAPGQNVTTQEPEPAAPSNETEEIAPPAGNETGGEFPTQLPVFPAENETVVTPSPGENITVTEPPTAAGNETTPEGEFDEGGLQPSQLPASSNGEMFGSFVVTSLGA